MYNHVFINDIELKILNDLLICKNPLIYQILNDNNESWYRVARYDEKNDNIKICLIPKCEIQNISKY